VTDYAKNGAAVGGGASLSDATPAALGTAAAGVSTSASRADHVHAAVTASGITDSTATGRALLTAADAAAGLAAIGAATAPAATVYDFASATGFTTNNGAAGTASIVSGVARLSNPAGTAHRVAGSYDGPSTRCALPSPSLVDVAVRLAVGPVVSGSNVTLEISDAATAGTRVCVGARSTREVFFYRNDSNILPATAPGAFASYTGQEWLRIRAVPGFVLVYYGTGTAGALPTSWTQVGSPLALSAYWSHVTMGLIVVDTASTSTIDLDDLTILSAPVASL